MDASSLLNRPADVTRSTVQKAVVVIADSPQGFGQIREKLSMVTAAWFAQRWGRTRSNPALLTADAAVRVLQGLFRS